MGVGLLFVVSESTHEDRDSSWGFFASQYELCSCPIVHWCAKVYYFVGLFCERHLLGSLFLGFAWVVVLFGVPQLRCGFLLLSALFQSSTKPPATHRGFEYLAGPAEVRNRFA